jgi:hypothetical protein
VKTAPAGPSATVIGHFQTIGVRDATTFELEPQFVSPALDGAYYVHHERALRERNSGERTAPYPD